MTSAGLITYDADYSGYDTVVTYQSSLRDFQELRVPLSRHTMPGYYHDLPSGGKTAKLLLNISTVLILFLFFPLKAPF